MRSSRFPLMIDIAWHGALGLVAFAMLTACAGFSDGNAMDREVASSCTDGSCVRATAGCDVEDIEQRDGVVCASCDSPSGGVEICGAAEVARCEARVDAQGSPCRFCATAFGELLYDSCFTSAQPAAVACEPMAPSAAAISEDVSGGVDPDHAERDTEGDASDGEVTEDDIVCQTCTDAEGRVVNTVCEPAHDECHTVQIDGGSCRECTRGGEVVIFTCQEPRLEPRSCEVYADADGRCVDCYDDADHLLIHECTVAAQAVGCSQLVTPEGLTCDVCVDDAGAVVSKSCRDDAPRLERCTVLSFTEQECLVCLDQNDAVALTRCQSSNCTAPECPAPPACGYDRAANGAWCRTCPVGQTGAVEMQCIEDTNLACAADGGADVGAFGTCITCRDARTDVEVYRRCDDATAEGAVPPPACVVVEDDAGSRCEVCSDPGTGQAVYATCADQSCYDAGAFPLLTGSGEPLFVDGQPAVTSCVACVAASADAVAASGTASSTCSLRSECGPVDLRDPTAPCRGAVEFTLRPRACINPWMVPQAQVEMGDVDNAYPGAIREAYAVLSYALAQAGVGLISVSASSKEPVACAEGCACPRGDRIRVSARAADAVAVLSLFGDVIEPCAGNDACAPGICRIDGACGY